MYEDYWTSILDKVMLVSPGNRKKILNYGSEYFTSLIKNCEFDIIKIMIRNLQNFLRKLVTSPETGDNRLIFQSAFHNRNVREGGMKRGRMLAPEFYGWPKDLQICINVLYKMQHFINFDEFQLIFKEKTGKSTPQLSPVS